jgi:glycosyltransferase involved in cell wall biosynthesis
MVENAPERMKASLKVMMVSTSLGYGGADTQIVNIARMLRSRGWKVTVVSMIPPAAHVGTLAGIGVPVYSLKMRSGVPDPRAVFRLADLIQQENPDVVHSHMVHANLLSRLTRLIARMPALICTAHNTRESSRRGGPTWHKELLYRLTDRLADQTTIICKAGAGHYIRRKAVPPSRLQVIPIGIDCADFSPSPAKRKEARLRCSLHEGHFTFLSVGRFVVQKDYPNLLQAFALLRHRSWTLLIAGSGPLQPELERLRDELSLTNHVRFVGVRQDVRDWYYAADAFVLGSAVEGMPVVLLEAAAAGLPAVVTDAGGNPEVVIDGKTGFVVEKQNHRALARAIEQMLEIPVTRRMQFGADARLRAIEEFEIGQIVTRWESLYRSCLSRRVSCRNTVFASSGADFSEGKHENSISHY